MTIFSGFLRAIGAFGTALFLTGCTTAAPPGAYAPGTVSATPPATYSAIPAAPVETVYADAVPPVVSAEAVPAPAYAAQPEVIYRTVPVYVPVYGYRRAYHPWPYFGRSAFGFGYYSGRGYYRGGRYRGKNRRYNKHRSGKRHGDKDVVMKKSGGKGKKK